MDLALEQELFRQMEEGNKHEKKHARDQLICSVLNLARWTVKKYRSNHIEKCDHTAQAFYMICVAVDRFDRHRVPYVRWRTYVVSAIRFGLNRYDKRNTLIRIPEHMDNTELADDLRTKLLKSQNAYSDRLDHGRVETIDFASLIDHKERMKEVRKALCVLSPVEKTIYYLRFTDPQYNTLEIAKAIQTSRQNVQQCEKRIIKKIRRFIHGI